VGERGERLRVDKLDSGAAVGRQDAVDVRFGSTSGRARRHQLARPVWRMGRGPR